MKHIPVLAEEVLEGLHVSPGASVIDATVGLGGHSALILKAIGEEGKLFAFDRDARNLEEAKQNLGGAKQVAYFHDSFANLDQHGIAPVDAMLFDLGFSSVHVDDASRGFSFQQEGPLDMRYDIGQELRAEEVVNSWSREDLAQILRTLGEEPLAAKIAKAIFDARRKQRITTTTQLTDVIVNVAPRKGRIHPATKTFQALRMAVNDELGQVEKGLKAAVGLLKPGGRLAVLTFHSLEDRLVKQFYKHVPDLEVITKKPITAQFSEKQNNPRARSAKLRVAQKK